MAGKTQGSRRAHPVRDKKAMPGSAAPKTNNKTPTRKPMPVPPMRGRKSGM